jgi:hypothetical protein
MHERDRGHLRLVSDAEPAAEAADADRGFAAFHALAAQLLNLRDRAREVYQTRAPLAFDGLGALLDELLPGDDALAERVARAVRLPPRDLAQLRAGVADPLVLPAPGIVRLGEAAALSLRELETLAVRDHRALAGGARPGAPAPPESGPTPYEREAVAVLRRTWDQLYGDAPPL